MAILGISFPFREGDVSFPKEARDAEAIKASLVQIVCTSRGERVMRPDFGCDAFSYVFATDNEAFRASAEREIRMAVSRWEPRVEVAAVAIESNVSGAEGAFVITIQYVIRSTGQLDNVSIAGGC